MRSQRNCPKYFGLEDDGERFNDAWEEEQGH
jgi:hypothetical protein